MNVGLLDKVTPLKPHHFWSVQVPEVIKQWASNSLSLIFCLVSEYKFWSANRDGSTIRDLAGWSPHFKSPRSRNMLTVISMGLYIPLMVHNSSCFFFSGCDLSVWRDGEISWPGFEEEFHNLSLEEMEKRTVKEADARGLHGGMVRSFIIWFLLWVKDCNKPRMTGNGNHITCKNGDFGDGFLYCFTHFTILITKFRKWRSASNVSHFYRYFEGL